MDGLTPEDVAREIVAQLGDFELVIAGDKIVDMWSREAYDALDKLADRFARVFMERNKAFNAVAFRRECGFSD